MGVAPGGEEQSSTRTEPTWKIRLPVPRRGQGGTAPKTEVLGNCSCTRPGVARSILRVQPQFGVVAESLSLSLTRATTRRGDGESVSRYLLVSANIEHLSKQEHVLYKLTASGNAYLCPTTRSGRKCPLFSKSGIVARRLCNLVMIAEWRLHSLSLRLTADQGCATITASASSCVCPRVHRGRDIVSQG